MKNGKCDFFLLHDLINFFEQRKQREHGEQLEEKLG